jgi:signal transduction histidine kinase/tetratricopeptide (TPR) repeat protein
LPGLSAKRPMRKKGEQKPKFFWQATLVLLPVMVLAGVAFFSLRQDKRLAQSEAAERAQSIADELMGRVRSLISQTSTNDDSYYVSAFEVDTAGQLVFPPPRPDWPLPQELELSVLDPEQARTWQAARNLEIQHTNLASAEQCYSNFLASNPPKRFAASGNYARALLLDEIGNLEAASQSFEEIVSKYADVTGETGLPLLPLAQFRLFQLSSKHSSIAALESFYSNIVHSPTSLSSMLMMEANKSGGAMAGIAQKWHSVWEQHERACALYQTACQNFGANRLPSQKIKPWDNLGPRLFWFEVDLVQMPAPQRMKNNHPKKMTWLATRCREEALSCWFVCKTDSQVYREIQSVANNAKQIPEYFGIDFELCGKKFVRSSADLQLWTEHHHGGKGGGWDKEYSDKTASASELLGSAVYAENGNELLKVNVYLTSPATLFSRQRARSFWFSALIGTSAAAALLGLMRAWRTFNRQQQLAELKSNFVSSVSHELRAPIASVRLMAESLERGKISGSVKQQEYYQFILQECRRLSSLVENVLDFSRIEQGRKEYEFEPTDLVALTEQTVKLMEPYASERQVKLTFSSSTPRHSPLDTHLSLDGKALQQALVNLIDNAIKHSPNGGTVTVGLEMPSVEATSVEATSVECRVSSEDCASFPLDPRHSTLLSLFVEDHGEGIPSEEHEKIFERFYRLGSELRRETQGVGIGLSIVKHIVEAHGGRVTVRSAVGQGSKFTIELPLKMTN